MIYQVFTDSWATTVTTVKQTARSAAYRTLRDFLIGRNLTERLIGTPSSVPRCNGKWLE